MSEFKEASILKCSWCKTRFCSCEGPLCNCEELRYWEGHEEYDEEDWRCAESLDNSRD
jgi:hypothetical protein